jgi:3-phenylpropionate/trans-cinnamate dioxygenase ferredoxin subunit
MSTDYVSVAPCADLPTGTCKAFDVGGTKIIVAHLADGYRAVENRCSHANSPLLTNRIYRGNQIACPVHGARFNLKTGEAKSPPAFISLKMYPVRVNDGRIEVAVA